MKKMNKEDEVVYWGHKMLLMLKIKNHQIFKEFYSVMHDKYYNENLGVKENLLNLIDDKKPKIIVDYDPGNMLGKIPSSIICNYQEIFRSGDIKVFNRINEKI